MEETKVTPEVKTEEQRLTEQVSHGANAAACREYVEKLWNDKKSSLLSKAIAAKTPEDCWIQIKEYNAWVNVLRTIANDAAMSKAAQKRLFDIKED